MPDIDKTIHYTTKAQEICASLIKYIPNNAQLIEPFVGQGDLVQLFPTHNWEVYDLQNNYPNVIIRDTLKNPPNYKGKWVITNPPFLARNKAKEKAIFDQYGLDDHYKIALHTALMADGGIFIIPTNFFTDERSNNIRQEFLSKHQVLELNIFTEPVFESTTYSVCAFAFQKKENEQQIIPTNVLPANNQTTITLYKKYNYQLAGDFYHTLQEQSNYFGRLTATSNPNDFITDLKLYALDTRTEHIHITYGEPHYIGKSTDRVYLTFTCKENIPPEKQQQLAINFNTALEEFRNQYHDLCLTNYRDYNRKRIGFTFAYQLLSYEWDRIKNE